MTDLINDSTPRLPSSSPSTEIDSDQIDFVGIGDDLESIAPEEELDFFAALLQQFSDSPEDLSSNIDALNQDLSLNECVF